MINNIYSKISLCSGCDVTTGKVTDGAQYYNVTACMENLLHVTKVVFLVHGFNVNPFGGRDFMTSKKKLYDIKERILEDDRSKDNRTAVIIVNWSTGSQIDMGLLLRDILEGALMKITDADTSSLTPVLEHIVSNLADLGPYHQAAANTRYTGAAIARLASNIKQVMSWCCQNTNLR